MQTDKYYKWVKDTKQSGLTNTQSKFAEWLLVNERAKIITQIGDLTSIFISIRRWLKDNPEQIEK